MSISKPTVVRYMPDVNIKFTAKGLKPYTKLYAFFGNRDVTNKIVVNAPSNNNQFITTDLITDIEGTISGTFAYKESELKFINGTYDFILTDSPDNSAANRTTFAISKFTSTGRVNYISDGTIRTRGAATSLNISTTETTYVNQPVYVESENITGSSVVSNIDVLDFLFMYGFGQKPSAEDKILAYELFTTQGVSWNDFLSAKAIDVNLGTETNGLEMWNTDGTPRTHPVLTYVDRTVVPLVVGDGETPGDLAIKLDQNAKYEYGHWDWFWLNKTQGVANDHNWLFWPATLYQAYYHPSRPGWTTQYVPYYDFVNYSCINSSGRKVYDRMLRFVNTFITREINDKNGIDGYLGYLAREYNYTAVSTNNNNIPIGNPKLPTVISVNDPELIHESVAFITTIYNNTFKDALTFTYEGVNYMNGDSCLQHGEWDLLTLDLNTQGQDAYNPTFDTSNPPTPIPDDRVVGTPPADNTVVVDGGN